MSVLIKLAVQLTHSDGLGVQGHHSHFLKSACFIQLCHSLHHSGLGVSVQ